MRRAAKVDANHRDIVAGLRKAGCSVISLAAVGNGCPDLLVGRAGQNFLFEVKDGDKCASRQKLTKDQRVFFATWSGQARVIRSLDDALLWITCG